MKGSKSLTRVGGLESLPILGNQGGDSLTKGEPTRRSLYKEGVTGGNKGNKGLRAGFLGGRMGNRGRTWGGKEAEMGETLARKGGNFVCEENADPPER